MPDDPFQCAKLNTAETLSQGVYFGDHHDSGNFRGDGLSYSYTMALKDLELKCCGIFFGDWRISEDAKSCVDAVDSLFVRNNLPYRFFAGPDFLFRFLAQNGFDSSRSNRCNIFNG